MTTTTLTYYVGDQSLQDLGGTSEYFYISDSTASVVVSGGSGRDYIHTGSGNDLIYGGYDIDVIIAGDGNNIIFGENTWDGGAAYISSADIYYDNDVIISGSGKDVTYAGGGDDRVNSGSGDDYIHVGSGRDIAYGGLGSDVIFGGDGDDILYGGSPYSVAGLWYSDIYPEYNGLTGTLTSALQVGVYRTGLGDVGYNDTGSNYIDGGAGADFIIGGDGGDSLLGGAGGDTIDGGAGDDGLEGGDGLDTIGGGTGNDVIIGGAGADYLDSGAGVDHVYGGDGEDLIIGGLGNDVLYGGESSDVFLFRAGDGPDVLMDFVAGSQADSVALQGTGLTRFAEVQTRMSWFEAGNATLLQIGNDQIFFNAVRPEQFDASDFFFV